MLSKCLQAHRTLTTRSSRALLRTNIKQLLSLSTVTNTEGNTGRDESTRQQTQAERESHHRRARLVSVMIGSAVGFIGGSYVLYRRLTNNKAQAEAVATIKEIQKIDELSEDTKGDAADGAEVTKKKRRSFKARRVRV